MGALRLGIHTSIAGSLENAALRAAELDANTFQIFSASPRMWRASMPSPEDIRRLRAVRERLDLTPLVIHDNYLINLAAADPAIRAKSIAAFRGEIERALAIGAESEQHREQPDPRLLRSAATVYVATESLAEDAPTSRFLRTSGARSADVPVRRRRQEPSTALPRRGDRDQ